MVFFGVLSMKVRWEFGRKGDKGCRAGAAQIHRAAVGIGEVSGSPSPYLQAQLGACLATAGPDSSGILSSSHIY